MADRLNWPARHPKAALSAALVAAILSLAGAIRLRPDTSLQSLFPPNDPAATALNRVLNHFPAAEELLMLVTTSGNEPHVNELIAFAARLESGIKNDPEAASLVAAINYRADSQTRDFITKVVVPNGMFYLDDAEFAAAQARLTRLEMTRQFTLNEAMLAAPGPAAGALAKSLLRDPLRLHEFIEKRLISARPMKTYENSDAFLSEDGRSLLIRIAGAKPPSNLAFCKQFTTSLSTIATRVNTSGLTIDLSGAYPIAAQSERSIRHDSISSVIGSIVCLALLFLLVFRRAIRLFNITFLPVAIGVLYGFGVYSIFSRNVTPLTAVIGAVLAGVGIDYSVFYLVHYLERRSNGSSPVEAASHTIQTIGGALVAAWVTSVVGFIAVVFASIPALRDFSIVGSLGLAGALIGATLLLPPLLVLMDRWKQSILTRFGFSRPDNRHEASVFRLSIRPLLTWIDRHSTKCMRASVIVLAASLAILCIAGPRLGMETDPTVLHPRPNPPLDAQAQIARRMGSAPDSLIVHLKADSPEGLVALAHRVNDQFNTPEAKNVGVTSTFGLATFLPDPAKAASRLAQVGPALAARVEADFDAAVDSSSFSAKAYEPYRTFLGILLTPSHAPGIAEMMPYPQLRQIFLPHETTAGVLPTEAITLVFLREAMDQRAVREASITQLRSLLKSLPGATLTGMAVLSLDTEATIHHDLPRLILAAVVIVALYLLVHFRSITDALLAVLPTLCSLTFLLVIARLIGAKVNLANIVAVPLLIGIDVDYGIFLVSVTRRTTTRADLLDRATSSSLAVIVCAMATLLGFGSLAFTSVPAIRSLGWAVAIGVSSCAVASLFFLLPLLLWLKGRVPIEIEQAPEVPVTNFTAAP
jgi:predicted RND superfamily exporter protein